MRNSMLSLEALLESEDKHLFLQVFLYSLPSFMSVYLSFQLKIWSSQLTFPETSKPLQSQSRSIPLLYLSTQFYQL